MGERQRRRRLSGGVYQRASDGKWCASITYPQPRGLPRKRRVIYGATRAEVEQKLATALADEPPLVDRTRRELLVEARDLGSHAPREWDDLLEASRGVCTYCRQCVGRDNLGRDHRIPLVRGGSDAIENLVPCCGPCNESKRTMTDVEYVAYLVLGPAK